MILRFYVYTASCHKQRGQSNMLITDCGIQNERRANINKVKNTRCVGKLFTAVVSPHAVRLTLAPED
jgi:hypothetical protein